MFSVLTLRPLQVLIEALQGIHIYTHAHSTIRVRRACGDHTHKPDPNLVARVLNKSMLTLPTKQEARPPRSPHNNPKTQDMDRGHS